jgi:hypothetical protein
MKEQEFQRTEDIYIRIAVLVQHDRREALKKADLWANLRWNKVERLAGAYLLVEDWEVLRGWRVGDHVFRQPDNMIRGRGAQVHIVIECTGGLC